MQKLTGQKILDLFEKQISAYAGEIRNVLAPIDPKVPRTDSWTPSVP